MDAINGVSGLTGAQSRSATGPVSNQQFSTDLFLQLLVTQLRYQDPMSESQDTGELITQLTMFTLLEQVIQLQQSVDDMNFAQANQQGLLLLNQEVEVIGPDGNPVTGVVTAVDFRSTGPYITVNGEEYPISMVKRVEGGGSADG